METTSTLTPSQMTKGEKSLQVISIDWSKFISATEKTLFDPSLAKRIRKECNIDDFASKEGKFVIQIPAQIESVSPDFLEELFRNVVKILGRTEFYQKFDVAVLYPYFNIDINLRSAVSDIWMKNQK